jgi:hypothetical protein
MIDDDAFGNWLAGFIDGEGCFTIRKTTKRVVTYSTSLAVRLRADDAAILREIQVRTGLGRMYSIRCSGQRKDGTQHHPCMGWIVASKSDCMGIVDLLDRYQLRAKKANDFAIWREAVLLWANVRHGGRHNRAYDWTAIGELAELLNAGRTYDGPAAITPGPDPQLRLVS